MRGPGNAGARAPRYFDSGGSSPALQFRRMDMTRNRILAVVAIIAILGGLGLAYFGGLRAQIVTFAAGATPVPQYNLEATVTAQADRIEELQAQANQVCPTATVAAPTATNVPATAMPTNVPATAIPATAVPTAQTVTCPPEWTGGWSKEDDFPTEGNRLGSASYWTVFQGWKAPDTKTTVQIIVAPGMQIVLPQGWTGTIWHTCQRFDDRWAEMVQELQVNNALDFLPPVIVIDAQTSNVVLPDGVSVVPFKADGAIVDPTLSDPFAEERFIVADEATTLLGDAQMWTYVKVAYPDNRSDLGVSILIAPGFAVRYPAGWQGIKQHLSGAPDLNVLSYDLIIDSDDDFAALEPFGLTGQRFLGVGSNARP